jgi:hypothetical protein
MGTYAGKGTKLILNSTIIGQVTSLTPPQMEVGTVETTDLDSTWRTHIPTIASGGTVSGTLNYDPTSNHTKLTALVTTPTTKAWKVVFPTTTLFYSFGGILTGFNPGAITVDGLHTADFTIQVTGAVTMPTTI